MDNAFINWARKAIADMEARAGMLEERRIVMSQMRDGQIVDTTAHDAADLRQRAAELEALIAGERDARLILPPGHG